MDITRRAYIRVGTYCKGEQHPKSRHTDAEVASLIAKFKVSGLSQRQFAMRHDIIPATFSRWLTGARRG